MKAEKHGAGGAVQTGVLVQALRKSNRSTCFKKLSKGVRKEKAWFKSYAR